MHDNPFKAGDLLKTIDSPKDLKKYNVEQLPQVCKELRDYIIDVVSVHGGHFGASLGVVELTTALHYVFDAPNDQIIFDVGHQAYGHKILTGRRDIFHTNRILNGLSGFPNRSESPYDAMGVGHSSTSISTALGMSIAFKIKGEHHKHSVAIIGDGALTAGMAFEGLNHAGSNNANVLVVLNDNCMSIDPNVGALKEYLTSITTSNTYNKFKDEVWNVLGFLNKLGPDVRSLVQNLENSLKSLLLKNSNIFEAFNFRYFGPVDGHDVVKLTKILKDLKDIPGPKLLHVLTVKGKGYEPAEQDQTKWHAPGLFDKITGKIVKPENQLPQPPKYQDVFGYTLLELAKANNKIMGITPAMPSGCSLNIMMKEMPDRAIDVGIAEQHAVTFSAGLAIQGMIPYCNIYSSFMQRAYDQVIHDVAIQNLPVIFCLDRGGIVGQDGATHHGAYDLAYFRCIPNMIVSAPMNEQELRNLMYTAQYTTSPFSIRYPRGNGVMIDWQTPFEKIEIGKGRTLKEGNDLVIITIGPIGNNALKVIEKVEKVTDKTIALYDLRFIKPIDTILLHHICKKNKAIITIEDACIMGGMGSAVLEFMADNGYSNTVKRLGIPDSIIEHGNINELWTICGYDEKTIESEILDLIK